MKLTKLLIAMSATPIIISTSLAAANSTSQLDLPADSTQPHAQLQRDLIAPCEIRARSQHEESREIIRPVDDCDGGGGGNQGPYRAPSVPSSITYSPYTNSNKLRIQWDRSNGYGHSVRYEVDQRKNNGSWVKIYTGYGSSKTVSNLGQGKYKFRVRAINTKFKSGYRYSNVTAMVNPRQNDNLYTDHGAIMQAMDVKNRNYRNSTVGAKTVLSRAKSVGQSNAMSNNEGRFYLGDGFDLVRGTLKETCLDVTNPSFVITKTPPLQPSTFGVDYVNDNRQLAELLEVSQSAQIGFSGDDFSLGLSGEKERYVKSVTDESHVRFVVKVKNRREFWKLNTPTDAIYPELVSQILSPNNSEAKADFRERCGDNFINSANLGSALYLVFTFDAKKYTYEERQNAKAELELKLGDVFSLGGASGSSSSLTEVLNRLQVKVNADQVGGPIGLAAGIRPNNVIQKYNQFVQDTNPSNWAAVDYTTNNYQRPTVYNGYSHEQIFAKYSGNQGPLAQMRRWLDLSVQHKERCDPWAEYGQSRPTQCNTSEAEISIAMDLCRETREWANCKHPIQYNTGNFAATSPGTYLLGWLSQNVKKLNENSATRTYNHHKHRGSITVDDRTCLNNTQCFTNQFRGSGPGIGKGFSVYTSYYDNPKGSHPKYSVYPKHCARTQAYLKTGRPPFGDTTADWHYTVNVEGLCPSVEDFLVIP